VLNAFRHHGLLHDDLSTLLDSLPPCSTPFGITDFFTYRTGRDHPLPL
jgi:hypothetical protein